MIKNILANFVGRFWSILSNFLFIPIYIEILGFESYSIISFTLVVTGIMAVLDSGLTATLSREFSRSDNTRLDKIEIFRTLETSYIVIISLIVVIVIGLSDFLANSWLNLDALKPEDVSFALKIISLDIGFQLLLRFYTGGLLGLEKQVKANMFQVAWGMLRNGLVVLVIWFFPSLDSFFLWQAGSTIVVSLLLGFSLKKELLGFYKFTFKPSFETKIFQKIWRFAGGMFLISLVAAINTQLDKLAISKFMPLESLGYYTLAVSLSMGIVVLVNPISIALLPRFTSLYSVGRKDEASLLFKKVNLLVAVLVFSIFSNMSFFAKDLIWIWTGKFELAENAAIYVPLVSLSVTMLSIATIPYNVAIANGYTKLNNVLGIFSLVLTVPGYWIATNLYGGIGAAAVYCFVQTAVTLIYIYHVNSRFLNEKRIVSLYFNQIAIPFFLTLFVSFVFSKIPEIFIDNRLGSLAWIGLSTVTTMLVSLLALSPSGEIKRMVKSVRSVLHLN